MLLRNPRVHLQTFMAFTLSINLHKSSVYVVEDENISWWRSLNPTSAALTDSASRSGEFSEVKNTTVPLQHVKLPSFACTLTDSFLSYHHGQISYQDLSSLHLYHNNIVFLFSESQVYMLTTQALCMKSNLDFLWLYTQSIIPWLIMLFILKLSLILVKTFNDILSCYWLIILLHILEKAQKKVFLNILSHVSFQRWKTVTFKRSACPWVHYSWRFWSQHMDTFLRGRITLITWKYLKISITSWKRSVLSDKNAVCATSQLQNIRYTFVLVHWCGLTSSVLVSPLTCPHKN